VVATAGCLFGGIGSGLLNVQTGTLLQTLSPGPLLGRLAGALQSTLVAGQLVGLLLTPLLVPILLPMGAYFVVVTLVLALLALAIGLCRYRPGRILPVRPPVEAGGATV
jgi:MFS family permease